MEKLLKNICIICIMILIGMAIYNIYWDFVLPKMYDKNTQGENISEESSLELCNKAINKYFISVKENIKNIKYFIPSTNRNDDTTQIYSQNLEQYFQLRISNIYYIKKDIYKIEYSIFDDISEKYSMIIKFNEKRNFYTILYDELYMEGRGK